MNICYECWVVSALGDYYTAETDPAWLTGHQKILLLKIVFEAANSFAIKGPLKPDSLKQQPR